MGRKTERRVPCVLDSKGITKLQYKEICTILRAADTVIGIGGRTMLAKILKGSEEKKIFEYNLDNCPAYRSLDHLKKDEIIARIDWLIENQYLYIDYDYRLPLIHFTEKGWKIVKYIMVNEYMSVFNNMLASGADHFNMQFLKDRNRELVFQLLDTIKETKNKKYIPLLKDWALIDYNKVSKKIYHVLRSLKCSEYLICT